MIPEPLTDEEIASGVRYCCRCAARVEAAYSYALNLGGCMAVQLTPLCRCCYEAITQGAKR
jgi:hypothetical protein